MKELITATTIITLGALLAFAGCADARLTTTTNQKKVQSVNPKSLTPADRFLREARMKKIKDHQEELQELYGSAGHQQIEGSSGVGDATTTWTTTLNASTYKPGHHVWAFAPGYSALVGTHYVTTDVDDTLYALNSVTGMIEWTYSAWPKLDKTLAFQRQITGDPHRMIVYRGKVIYYFNATNGDVIFTIPLKTTDAVVYVYNGMLLVTYGNTIETMSLTTGEVIWSLGDAFTNNVVQTQTRYTANADGSKDLVAFAQGHVDSMGHQKFHLVIYNSSTGQRVMKSHKELSSATVNPYIFIVDRDGLYTADFTTNKFTRVDMMGHEVYSVDYGGKLTGYGVAPIDYVFFKLGNNDMAIYNRSSGELVSQLPNLQSQGVNTVSHVEGYQGFGLLVMEMNSGLTNVSAWAPTTLASSPPLWTFTTNHTDHGHVVFGNWLGIVTIMSTNGLGVLNGNDHGRVIFDGFSKFPDVNFQSLVTTNARETFFFTHSNKAVGMKFSTTSTKKKK